MPAYSTTVTRAPASFARGRAPNHSEAIELADDAVGLALRFPTVGTVWKDVPAALEIVVPFGNADADVECRGGGGVQRGRLTSNLVSIAPAGVHRTVAWRRATECIVLRISPKTFTQVGTDAAFANAAMRAHAAVRDDFVRRLVSLVRSDILGSEVVRDGRVDTISRLTARHLIRVHSTRGSSATNFAPMFSKLELAA